MNHSRSWRAPGLAAAGVSAGLLLAACGGGEQAAPKSRAPKPGSAVLYAASTSVVNPSDKKGGTLKFANPADWTAWTPVRRITAMPGISRGSTVARS